MGEQHKPAIVQRMDDALYQRLARVLPKSQYRPYKLWTFDDTNTGQARRMQILNIKVNDQEAYSVCPELHLVAHGSDYLEVTNELQAATLEELGLPISTRVTQTDTVQCDLDGTPIETKAISQSASPEPAPDATMPIEEEPAPVERAKEGLFADITDELDLDETDDTADSDDAVQPSLF